jgi:hypothetical protein
MLPAYKFQIPANSIHVEPAAVSDGQPVSSACKVEFRLIEYADLHRGVSQERIPFTGVQAETAIVDIRRRQSGRHPPALKFRPGRF